MHTEVEGDQSKVVLVQCLKTPNTSLSQRTLCLLTKKEKASRKENELRAYTRRGRRNVPFWGTRSETEGLFEREKIENRVLSRE